MRYISENIQSYYGFDYIPASRNDELGWILQGIQSQGKQAYYDSLETKSNLMSATDDKGTSQTYDNQFLLKLPIV